MVSKIGLIDLLYAAPLLILLLFAIAPITIKVLRGNREPNANFLTALSVVGLVGVGFLAYMLTPESPVLVFGGSIAFDRLSALTSAVILFLSAATVIVLNSHVHTAKNQLSEMLFLLISCTLGSLVLVAANDLITIFIGLELMSLPLYLMVAMSNEQKLSKEASFKYFILGSFATGLFLYGMSFIFGTIGAVDLPTIGEQAGKLVDSNRLFLVGLVFLVIGFCFKVSLFPLHAWAPDVYTGAATPMTAFMSTAVKIASFVAFLRFAATQATAGSTDLINALMWISALTMFVGNAGAIVQTNFKRLLAYSSVAHSGYIFMGLLVVMVSTDHSQMGASATLFYLVGYSLMTFGAFALVSLLETKEGAPVNVDDLAGYAKKQPMLAACLSLFLLSLAGIPPLVGFFGKFFLFSAALAEGFYWLVLMGVVNSVISVYFYLRPIVVMYMQSSEKELNTQSLVSVRSLVMICFALVIAFGVFSTPLLRLTKIAVLGAF